MFGLWEAAAPPIAVLVNLVRVIPTVVPPAEPMKFRTKKYPEPELPSPATACRLCVNTLRSISAYAPSETSTP